MRIGKSTLDRLYRRYNRRALVHPDPLEFLYEYPDIRDREIAGLIASSLAYGRVAQILKSVRRVLTGLGASPHRSLMGSSEVKLRKRFSGFKHRFSTDADLVALLTGTRSAIAAHGSLNECFASGMSPTDETVLPALEQFVTTMNCGNNSLLPLPSRGSPCKRLNLFLRWMVREDAVDPGGWRGVSPAKLVVPLDTHMTRIGKGLGLTRKQTPSLEMAIEITRSFRLLVPNDPLKYDFTLTRFGIRNDLHDPVLERLLGDLARTGPYRYCGNRHVCRDRKRQYSQRHTDDLK